MVLSVILTKIKALAYNISSFFARTDVFFYSVIWLIVLLVFGTIAEKELGLDQAQRRYFSSIIFFAWNIIPLPGGSFTMGIIFFGLLFKLLLDKWELAKAGTIILHSGALLLLAGGFLTAAFSREGSMIIPEGETRNFFSSYHDIEFVIINQLDSQQLNFRRGASCESTGVYMAVNEDASTTCNKAESSSAKSIDSQQYNVTSFGQGWLKKNSILKSNDFPFQITIKDFYKNVSITKKTTAAGPLFINQFGLKFALKPAALLKEDEQNRPGVIFEIAGADHNENGLYAIVESMPIAQYISVHGKKYRVEIRHLQTHLPFSIQLVNFEKQFHPGTMNARSYKSEVILHDLNIEWRGLIKMNAPLRYKGYTFYQASFIDDGQDKATILAVVKNAGRTYPYISSIVMCIGLLIHLVQRLRSGLMKNADLKTLRG